MMGSHEVDVLVIGGGIAGLSAVYRLANEDPSSRIALLEANSHPGGKMKQETFADGHCVDVGPDAIWVRSPAVERLLGDLGIGTPAVRPVNSATGILHNGTVIPLPSGIVAGIPTDVDAAKRAGLLSNRGALRASREAKHLASQHTKDCSVFDAVEERLGTEVAERIVDPLVGGIAAGNTRELSLQATAPMLYALYAEGKPFLSTLSRTTGRLDGLATFDPDGVSVLVDACCAAVANRVEMNFSSPVTAMSRISGKWHVWSGDNEWTAAEVILAVPAPVAGTLLGKDHPHVRAALESIPYASVTTVTLALDSCEWTPHSVPGFVVPRTEGELVTAVTCLSERWTHHRKNDTVYVRCSVGRIDDTRHEELSDADLAHRVHETVERLFNVHAPLREAIVHRWENALPQYTVGHRDRIMCCTPLRDTGVECIGAAYSGIGISSCIEQADAAVERIVQRRIAAHSLTGVLA
ncbi:MAG: protoporphyrinogen oxidase [Candidatus Dormibacteria bacterium]